MNNLFRYFSIISKHSNVYLDKALEQFELCGCHRVFIKRITENPGITRDKIKQIAHVHPSNTTRTIDYMESLGYIIKKISEQDKRICELYPTEKLKEVYDVLVKAENEWIDIITKGMSTEELEVFTKSLEVMTTNSIECIHKKEN